MARIQLVLNWKMNPERLVDAETLFAATKRISRLSRSVGLVACPPTLFLGALRKKYDGNVLLGAQDVYHNMKGSHTGSISPDMLSSLGVKYVIVGHSERRRDGETDALVSQKAIAALASHLSPIVCIGEHSRTDTGEHFSFIESQLTASLKGIPKAKAKNIVIAYEPLWAIGKTYSSAIDPLSLQETVIFIRKVLTKIFGRSVAMSIPVLYGGSVESKNIAELVQGAKVSGFLIGHASLDADELRAIVRAL